MKKTINELRTALKNSVVNFTFTKLNGEKREARGTININLVPKEYQSKSTSRIPSDKVITYFDLDANGYRNVSVNSEVSF